MACSSTGPTPATPTSTPFLATLSQKKRKNIRAERRRVAEAGITFRQLRGAEIDDEAWKFFNRCYRQTYREHHSSPYLNPGLFPTHRRDHARKPAAGGGVAGRPRHRQLCWSSSMPIRASARSMAATGGALEHHPCLHFETAYYQPLDFCIAEGLRTFEGGAQGEHKMARGFLPVATRSAHWLAHPRSPMPWSASWPARRQGIDAYLDELNDHSPFARGE